MTRGISFFALITGPKTAFYENCVPHLILAVTDTKQMLRFGLLERKFNLL